jgi:hypothetical protein
MSNGHCRSHAVYDGNCAGCLASEACLDAQRQLTVPGRPVEFVSPQSAQYVHQHRDAGARERDMLARIAELEAENAMKQEMLTMISTRVQMWAGRNAELVAEIAELKQGIAAEVIAGVDAYQRSLTPAPLSDVSRETFPPNALKHSR